MGRWIIAGAAAVAAVLLLVFFLYDPAANSGENGTFANDCCGTVQLTDGKMLLNDQQTVRYKVGRDATGPYLFPRAYVGVVEDQGFEVDGTRPTLKLRLDKLPAPTRIILYGGRTPYVFTRQPPRRHVRP